MQFKKLTRDDIQLIRDFNKKHSPPPPQYHVDTADELNSLFDNKSFICYGVYQEDEMIAQVSYIEESETVYFLGVLIIHQQFRNQGLGSKIFNKVKEEIKTKGGKKIILTVSPQNESAVCFYIKQGFKIYDTKKDVYGSGTDRQYMQLEL